MTRALLQPSCSMSGKHCDICTRASAMICCECGDALIPFHPDIEGLWKDGVVRWP